VLAASNWAQRNVKRLNADLAVLWLGYPIGAAAASLLGFTIGPYITDLFGPAIAGWVAVAAMANLPFLLRRNRK
jgi:hypothetical protein